MINILTGGNNSGGGLKMLAYLPFVRMVNSKAVGLSKQADGVTDAQGTLYPSDLNNSSNLGSLNSFVGQMAGYSLGVYDDEIPAHNATKTLVGESYFTRYKRFKYAKFSIAKKWRQQLTNQGVDSNSRPFKAVELDSNRIMIFFKAAGSGYFAQVIKRDASNIFTLGDAVQLETNNASTSPFQIDAVLINTDKVLFVQTVTRNARVASVSDTTITLGSAVAYITVDSDVSLAFVDTNKAIVAYNDSGDGKARIITVSGTTVTMNTEASLGVNAILPYVAPNSSSKVQITYRVSSQQKTRVLSISGTTVTPETAVDVGSSGESGVEKGMFNKIASDKFLLLSQGALNKARIISVSGTTSSVATSTLNETMQSSDYNSLVQVTAGTEYLFYQITDSNNYRKVRKLTISGTTVTDSVSKDISVDRPDSQTQNIYQGTVWNWGSDTFLFSSSRFSGSHNGFYGYIGNVNPTTFELYNNATLIGSAISTDYSYVEQLVPLDSVINTGKKCYFGIKNTSGAARLISLMELLVEVD